MNRQITSISLQPSGSNSTTVDSRQSSTSKRSSGLDVVRTIACLTVIASHYFLHTSFNTSYFEGLSMFLQGMMASIVIGSDLYMILTGFLCCNKVFGSVFYKSGIKVVLSYIFFSLLTIVVNVYVFHTGMTWKSGLLGILSFNTIPYAWYIEMWIGLFLMAPFLNIWYKALPSKRMKLYLIALLLALSAFPDFFNRYGFELVPAYWKQIYPIGFYFIGCFLREYRPVVPRTYLLLMIVLISMIAPGVTLTSHHPTFLHILGTRSGVFISAIAVAVFIMFYNVDVKNKMARNIFKMISLRSLDIFLCSATFDFYIYPLFNKLYFANQAQYGLFFFILVPLIFILCYLVASLKRIIFNILARILVPIGVKVALQSKNT